MAELPATSSSPASGSSQALILWRPKYLFLPPIQDSLLPTHVFRHVILDSGSPDKQYIRSGHTHADNSHIPDRDTHLPPFLINETFLHHLLSLPPTLPCLQYPSDQNAHHQEHSLTAQDAKLTHVNQDNRALLDGGNTIASNQSMVEDTIPMEWEGSSLETIDENPVRSPPKLTLTPQAHSLKIKAKKVVLKRKTPQPTHSVVYNDVFSADIRDPDGIGGGDTMNKRSRSSSDEEASQEQWRVGKMPGHQGSHFRSPKKVRSRTSSPAEGEGVTGKKRTFSQSITSSAERVLKKPFRPPTRVGPKLVHTNGERKQCSSAQGSPAISHEAPASSSSPSQTVPSEPDTSLNPDFDAIFTDSPSSAGSRKSRSFHSQSQSRASKPFKVPSRQDRSFAPSPNTKSGQARSETSSEQARIVILQNEILEAKKALKVVTDSDEEQIKELIYTWRNAGREIVERLFRDIPKLDRPITSSTSAGSDSQYIAGFSQSKSISYWSSPDDDLRTPMLTPEQAEYLKNAPRNADGEPVDEDGNLLIPDSGDEARFWEELGDERRFGDEKYQGGWSRQEESRLSGPTYAGSMGTTETETGTEATAAAPDQWNYAALMRMMNVDPDLLGFDESTEEWIEYANEDQD